MDKVIDVWDRIDWRLILTKKEIFNQGRISGVAASRCSEGITICLNDTLPP